MRYDFDTPLNRFGSGSVKWAKGALRYGRADAIPMWVADMDFAVPQLVVDAVKARAAYPIYGYGYISTSLCEAIAERLDRKYGWRVEPEWPAFTPGVVPAIKATVRTFTEPGDAVVIQPPVYPPFMSSTTGSGCRLVYNPLTYSGKTYSMDFDDLERRLSDACVRMMILCSPHNPIGRVWTEEELGRVGEIAREHGVLVLSDEIHSELVLEGHHHVPLASISPELAQNTITCISPSKTFNLAGLSAAVVIIPNAGLRRRFSGVTDGTMGDINVFGLTAMEAAYRDGDEWLDQVLPYIMQNVNYLCRFLEEKVPEIRVVVPEGTYLVWLDCRGLGLDSSLPEAV